MSGWTDGNNHEILVKHMPVGGTGPETLNYSDIQVK
jgi:hypothetical protein